MKKNYHIEICANSVASCIAAQEGGATRVELCAAIPEGGTTPSYGEVAIAREQIQIQLHTIIRPRGGDFLYSDIELKTMCKDIEIMHKLGVDGIVIGCLTADGNIDMEKNKILIEAAKGMSITFHRAFDMCQDPMKGLEEVIQLGCHRLLTSGQMPKAIQGVNLISQMVKKADGRIAIMPGSGINANNIQKIAQQTQATEFHLSARERIQSQMSFRNQQVSMGGTNITIDEYIQENTNAQLVREIISILKTTS